MTTLVRFNAGRWAPVREVAVMQNELSRLMNGLFEGNGRQTQSWVPTLDAWETEQRARLRIRPAGIAQDGDLGRGRGRHAHRLGRADARAEVSEESFHRYERRYGTLLALRRAPAGSGRGRDQGLLQGRRARDPRSQARAGEAEEDRDRSRRRAPGDDRGPRAGAAVTERAPFPPAAAATGRLRGRPSVLVREPLADAVGDRGHLELRSR